MKKNLHVGISFHLDESCHDIWANGAVQNIIFQYQMMQQMASVDRVSLVYLGNLNAPPQGLMLDGIDLDFIPLNEAVESIDVLIEMGLVIDPYYTDQMKKRGGKCVSMRVGNDFIMDMERFVFDQPPVRTFTGAQFDAVWTIPQHARSCRSYFSIMLRAPFFVLPHIWSPFFSDKVINRLKNIDIHFGYEAGKGAKRISIFEPNISVLKSSFIPILICEEAYRRRPDLIEHIYTCNTFAKKDHPVFHNFIGRTDVVNKNILTVEARYQLPDFMARYTDVVVSHQWENGLNYVYYEVLYGGYPLIHNSKMLSVGYYYPHFDAFKGADLLIDVIENHDKSLQVYKDQSRDFLKRLDPLHPNNIHAYEAALQALFD